MHKILMKVNILAAIALSLAGIQPARAQDAASLKAGAKQPFLDSMSYYTTAGRLPVSTIQEKYAANQFKPLVHAVLNAGIPDKYYWIHFTITNLADTTNALVVDIDNARLNELELFEVAGNTVGSLGKLGDFYPFSQRSFLHKSFVYRVNLPPGRKKSYFLFANQIGHAFILPIEIYTAKNFSSSTFKDYLFDGVTYGILLFVGILSLLFFLTSKHYLYLFYSLYIITAIVWFLSYFGLGYQYLWGNHPFMNTLMSPFMASVNVLLNLQICQTLLRLDQSSRLLNRTANYAKAALVPAALFPVFFNINVYGYTINHHYLVLFLCSILFAMIVVSVSVIRYALKGYTAAKVYLIASLLKAGSIINLALLELGLSPALTNMEELLQIGIFVEITLLTYALANRYSIFKVRTFEKVIEAHEKERSLISKEIHDCISNSLTGINYGIEDITKDVHYLPAQKLKLEKVFRELDRLQTEARNISHNTMPDYIKTDSLADIAEKYVEEIRDKIRSSVKNDNFMRINFSANKQVINFSEPVKLNIFRITQELIANMLKHSKATHADLIFSFGKKDMTTIAEDNGIGYKPAGDGNKGMGIKNIRSRVELLDGSMSIQSPLYKRNPEPGGTPDHLHPAEHGTMIRIKIPYRDNLLNNKNGYDY